MERNKKCKRLLNDMKSVERKNISLFKRINYAPKVRKIPQTAIKSAMFFFSYLHLISFPQQALSFRLSS